MSKLKSMQKKTIHCIWIHRNVLQGKGMQLKIPNPNELGMGAWGGTERRKG